MFRVLGLMSELEYFVAVFAVVVVVAVARHRAHQSINYAIEQVQHTHRLNETTLLLLLFLFITLSLYSLFKYIVSFKKNSNNSLKKN